MWGSISCSGRRELARPRRCAVGRRGGEGSAGRRWPEGGINAIAGRVTRAGGHSQSQLSLPHFRFVDLSAAMSRSVRLGGGSN
ncbi:hypothetical protein GUJ93_ZPchr0007g5807 [Zizania palustris]|uniref:Uncharacterized protein n=1 Tax=Zizania palustris TaxID=103762 RepID=A0A8J5SU03_ZIZPA|nr:hypothetical protein GUJ93_ZPchr0007g5807 [Zizania palustris]